MEVAQQENYTLLLACKTGDKKAMEEIINIYSNPVHRLIYSILRNDDSVEDLAQETFVRMVLSIQNYEFRAPFKSWLFRIAVNLCRDHLRKKKVRKIMHHFEVDNDSGEIQDFEDKQQDPLSSIQSEEKMDMIIEALQNLSESSRTVFILREMNELTYEEIAKTLRWRIGTVKSRLFRARKELADILAPQLEELR